MKDKLFWFMSILCCLSKTGFVFVSECNDSKKDITASNPLSRSSFNCPFYYGKKKVFFDRPMA